ncbi:hypothetical protein LAZ67_2003513 [Cordylochernes scorpioides]|uniref:ATP-dependent DNA helicase n=1 Tax=Cordylochernes scorpioides TaxID=51811 RepID=A0ABY6K2Y7_9ARAC|nr:hypothetical protein LAZ67_2003513 [Cordylochernes scorpioides]
MVNRRSIEALDRTLRDLRDNNSIMGGVTFLFVGDFRQTLPVIPKGTRANEINACLKRSHIWSSIVKLSLTINMRSHLFGDRGSSFSQLLLELGNGTFATHEGLISIASSDLCVLVEDIHTLISSVYPNIGSLLTMPLSWFSERALLAPRNDAVDKINEYILSKFIAPSRTYLSIDTVVDPNDSVHYPIEFLNSINPPGMPVHSLTLKVGAPIILLRNLNPPKLCNGIRLQVNSLHRYLLEATILTGCGTVITTIKKYNANQHYMTHSNHKYEILGGEARKTILQQLKNEKLHRQQTFDKFFQQNNNATEATYKVAYILGKRGKPFSDNDGSTGIENISIEPDLVKNNLGGGFDPTILPQCHSLQPYPQI